MFSTTVCHVSFLLWCICANENDNELFLKSKSNSVGGAATSIDDASQRRTSRSTDRKQHTVRFNVNEEKTERRSESRESYTR